MSGSPQGVLGGVQAFLAAEGLVPAEAVYAVFEAKQVLNAENIKAAHEKAASVRKLTQTSAPIINAGVQQPGRPPIRPLVLSLPHRARTMPVGSGRGAAR